jgi:hypothetical protein
MSAKLGLPQSEPIVNHIRQVAATEPGAAKRLGDLSPYGPLRNGRGATGIPPQFLRTTRRSGALAIVWKAEER